LLGEDPRYRELGALEQQHLSEPIDVHVAMQDSQPAILGGRCGD